MIPITPGQYQALAEIANREAGLHMPATRQSFVVSRLQRRLRHHELRDFGAYLALLGSDGSAGQAERRDMISALTTNVTELFREPHHFALLSTHLAQWRRAWSPRVGRYAIWSAGCASGEEPLSIAATCRAVLGTNWSTSVRIVATDVDAAILERARHRSDSAGLPTSLSALPDGVPRARWDTSREDALVVDLQGGIDYVRHNVLEPLPVPGQFNAIFCRNVTIYFSPAAQQAVHDRLRDRLADDGMIALGHSERLLGHAPEMAQLGRTTYRRVGHVSHAAKAIVRPCH